MAYFLFDVLFLDGKDPRSRRLVLGAKCWRRSSRVTNRTGFG